MIIKVNKIKYIKGYSFLLRFTDGTARVIDFKKYLTGEIYEPLKNIDYFKKAKLQYGTVTWDNGADFAPEFLYTKGEELSQKKTTFRQNPTTQKD